MPTIQQLVRKGRAELVDKSKSPALDSCPHRVFVITSFVVRLIPPVWLTVSNAAPNTELSVRKQRSDSKLRIKN